MRHLGDVTKISGFTAPPVDVVIGGSPCQDLSVAGKRAGLDGERSGLFMEQIRIVKEMRKQSERNGRADADVLPRYLVWENVPGALSSNRGGDFRTVLEEIARVKDENAVIPEPPKGKWTSCGCILGDGYSIAWRILDAQFWGTPRKPLPQRRRRIALVADFGGESAPEILFIRKSLQGDTDESRKERQGAAPDAEGGSFADDRIGIDLYNTNITGKVSSTLGVNCGKSHGRNGVLCYDIGEARLRTPSEYKDICLTLSARCGTGENNTPAVVFKADDGSSSNVSPTLVGDHNNRVTDHTALVVSSYWDGGQTVGTLTSNNASGCQRMPDKDNFNCVVQKCYTVDQGGGKSSVDVREGQAPNLTTTHDGAPAVVYAMDRASFNQGKNAQFDFEVNDRGADTTVVAKGPGAVAYGFPLGFRPENVRVYEEAATTLCNGTRPGFTTGLVEAKAVDCRKVRYIVRRLTPLECERLQGYPDGWTDIGEWTDSNGKVHKTSDAARYKALGNSIALPPWKWVLKRICANYERDATMASLFDGLGGFPKIWEELNGKGSCLWASEVEEFCIAVTKVRIGE